MSNLPRAPTTAILATGTGPETLRLLVSNTPCHGVHLHVITTALAVWRCNAVVDCFLVKLRNDAGRIGLPKASPCSFAERAALPLSTSQERYGRTNRGSTLLFGADSAGMVAAVIGGAGTESNHSKRTHRRGIYGSYGQPGYGAPIVGRGFD
ncbi:hypothetical protein [Paracraurococcus lichenis]|uniref:Uncharacterized protein n=1 Tax=Paracraurococcus lichenis TaxID=3064888 RepID=A0ABT9E8K5_9PROT|nr:hypothetical protein [Paracraurococcus sp. LOR1-02]MDO9712541.1 hypothetical protein [Paracraurococcus sp. LOR1-02]